MLRLSKKMFYAVEAVLYIAYNSKSDPISSKDIAERQGLPPRYLEQIMQKLVRANILRGVRGPKGGYVLARERRRLSIADICDVIREMDALDQEQLQKTSLSQGVLYPLYGEMEQRLHEETLALSIADLCERAAALNIRRANDDAMDFAI